MRRRTLFGGAALALHVACGATVVVSPDTGGVEPCRDSVKNGTESDVDCGRDCTKCELGKLCSSALDCASANCEAGACRVAPTCHDGAKNGAETDSDCGGTCEPCAVDQLCRVSGDCLTRNCTYGRCKEPSCTDGVQDGNESDVDCGAACPKKCTVGLRCAVVADCMTQSCISGVCQAGVDAGIAAGLDGGDTNGPDATVVPPDAGPYDAGPYDAGPTCTSQVECGDPIENKVVNICQGGHCRLPGLPDGTGVLQTVEVVFESLYAASFSQPGNRPMTQVTRLIWGQHTDGTPVTCADVKPRAGATQATRNQLDSDPAINQSYRELYVLVWSGTSAGQTRFRVFGTVPRAANLIAYGEAWYGVREQQNPTGQRASVVCVEGVDLSTVAATPIPAIRLDFNP